MEKQPNSNKKTLSILNLRAGFATNSSSSHSVLYMWGHGGVDGGLDGYGYGWEFFTLASERLKSNYLASQLASSLGYGGWPEDPERDARVVEIVTDLLGESGDIENVDHQSQWYFPCEWDGTTLNREFLAELAEFLAQDEVVILGGNDNSENEHPLTEGHEDRLWSGVGGYDAGLKNGHTVARKDIDHWTLFNRENGMKTRIAFGDNQPLYSSAPELVDISITDFCVFDCKFCYRDSTVEGQHAPLADILLVAERLAAAEVFEVALGGGEPTMHPDFAAILDAFSTRGIVANFTTRSLAWLKDQELVARVKSSSGAFAFSVQKATEVDKLARVLEQADWQDGGRQPTLHIVMGTVSKEELAFILDKAREHSFGVTLLGYKRVGRGTEPEHPYQDWWLDVAREHGPYRLGIDTALAAESEQQLEEADVPRWMFHTEDGRFSAYIDAVKMTMGPSSWEPEREQWAFDDDWRQGWLKVAGAPKPPSPFERTRNSALADSQSAASIALPS